MAVSDRTTTTREAPSSDGGWAVTGIRRAWEPADRPRSIVFASALLLLVCSTLLGGAGMNNALGLMTVELVSLPLLFVSAYLLMAGAGPRGAVVPIVLLIGVVAIPIIQLIPLPPGVWVRLPGRGPILAVLDAMRLGRPALPLSLTPEPTWRYALALSPPAAMFLGGLLLYDGQRRVMAACWLLLATVSMALGALQLAQGLDSPLYLYSITNRGSAVGLFANRNHNAAFLVSLIPLAAVFAADFKGRLETWRSLLPLAALLYVFVALVGVAIIHSRAAIFLLAPALFGAVAVILRGGALRSHWRAAVGLGLGAAIAIIAVLLLGLAPIVDKFSQTADARFDGWPVVLKAAQEYLPFGSGLGSFDPVYRSLEPLGQVDSTYFNHAHDDYLELWLETGLVGAALLLAFGVWFVWQAVSIWTKPAEPASSLPAGCTLLILLLLAHSTLDFPLRTEALAVIFAFACAAIACEQGPIVALKGRSTRKHRS